MENDPGRGNRPVCPSVSWRDVGAVGMRLHHHAQSSASYRVRIVAALKGIALDMVPVDLFGGAQRGAAYSALNVQKMLPCLELDDGRTIAQSLAIIVYLDDMTPEPAIWPSDPVARALALALAQMIACETAPLMGGAVQRFLGTALSADAAKILEWQRHWIARGLAPIESHLAAQREGTPFAMGDAPGIVEAFLLPQLYNCARAGIDLSAFPHVRALEARALTHPAIHEAHPARWL